MSRPVYLRYLFNSWNPYIISKVHGLRMLMHKCNFFKNSYGNTTNTSSYTIKSTVLPMVHMYYSLKIIVKIDRSMLSAECSQTQTQESNIVYADPKLIYNAVNSEKSELEQVCQIFKMFSLVGCLSICSKYAIFKRRYIYI